MFYEDGERFQCNDVCSGRGNEPVCIQRLEFTDKRNTTVNLVAWWGAQYTEPLFWITRFETAEEAHFWYRKRFRIETLFSDMKNWGFNLHKSGLRCPERLSRLIIAVALAYVWMIYLGEYALQNDWEKIIHRTDRCDWSIFTLGRHLLNRLLRDNLKSPHFVWRFQSHKVYGSESFFTFISDGNTTIFFICNKYTYLQQPDTYMNC